MPEDFIISVLDSLPKQQGRKRGDPRARFYSKVDTSGDCHVWLGCKSRDGYGAFTVGRRGNLRAHRVAWILAYGDIPEGMFVCHKCDNPVCVRPSHLFLGLPVENTRDMTSKGRRADHRGERHPSCKLTDAQVEEIIRRRQAGEKLISIASDFNIAFQTVSALSRKGRLATTR